MKTAPPLPRRRTADPERVLPPTRKLVGWALLGGFVAGYLVIWLLFFPGLGRAAIVSVPDVRGKTLREARGEADDGGLAVVVGSTLANPYVPAGHVLAQEPMPGQEVTRGAVLHVIMSSGPTKRHVPDLAGMDVDDAKALLAKFGFTVAVTSVINPAYEGKILAIAPVSGTEVPLPATVQLTVSSGPPKVPAPSIVGLTLAEAQAKLDSAGLRFGRVDYDSASIENLGAIEGQRPAAGDSVRQGGGVSVTVSGRAPYVPPAPDSTAPAEGAVAPAATDGQPAAAPAPTPAMAQPPAQAAPPPAKAPAPPAPRPVPARPPAAPAPSAARPPATVTPAAPRQAPARPQTKPAARPAAGTGAAARPPAASPSKP